MRLADTPVAGVGQPWTYYEIDAEQSASGNATSLCLANQALHGQSESLQSLMGPQLVAPGTGPGREPAQFDRRSMSEWATHVNVPVYVSGALQDDETGPQWPALLDALPTSTPVYANLINGDHIDSDGSADDEPLARVPRHLRSGPSALRSRVPWPTWCSTSSPAPHRARRPRPPFRRCGSRPQGTSPRPGPSSRPPRLASGCYSTTGPVQSGVGDPQATYSADFPLWPPTGSVRQYFFGRNGALSLEAPAVAGRASLILDPAVRPLTSLPPGGNPWAADPGWDWTTVPPADGMAFQTAPFKQDTTIVGPATVDLWLTSTAPVVDLQVTVTEVRPSAGDEEYVTSGFLRSSDQVDLPTSTELMTFPTYLGADNRSLSARHYRLVRIPIDPIANTFRAGTELRLVISAPGGDRPLWAFDTLDHNQTATVGFGGLAASSLVVDQVSGVRATEALPPCGTLRGEPCRAFQAEGNQ